MSGDIGRAGGSLQIVQAGVTITFAPNDVSQRTRITMRALAGTAIAYEFEPQRLVFDVRPMIEQHVDKTNWKRILIRERRRRLLAEPASVDRDRNEADADEFFVTSTKGEKTPSFGIPHFSCSLVSSARQ